MVTKLLLSVSGTDLPLPHPPRPLLPGRFPSSSQTGTFLHTSASQRVHWSPRGTLRPLEGICEMKVIFVTVGRPRAPFLILSGGGAQNPRLLSDSPLEGLWLSPEHLSPGAPTCPL